MAPGLSLGRPKLSLAFGITANQSTTPVCRPLAADTSPGQEQEVEARTVESLSSGRSQKRLRSVSRRTLARFFLARSSGYWYVSASVAVSDLDRDEDVLLLVGLGPAQSRTGHGLVRMRGVGAATRNRTELLQLNRGAQYLPIGHYTIPPEIIKPPTGTPAAASRRRKRCERGQKRGKRAGVWARLKAKPFRLPLPTIFLSNARSNRNKMDEIRLQLSTLKALNNCCCMIFSETWLDSSTPDAAIELADRSVYRADRTADSGKKTGGGLSIYIANSWCTNNTVVDKLCSPDAELLLLKCRPFYLPREFSAVYICAVYIPPDANVKYTPKIKSAETTVRTVRIWPESAVPMLQDCFHHTDWEVFREQGTVTRDILDNYTTSVLDYICFCLDNVTTWKQSRVYPNTPPWMTHGVHQLLRARNRAFRSSGYWYVSASVAVSDLHGDSVRPSRALATDLYACAGSELQPGSKNQSQRPDLLQQFGQGRPFTVSDLLQETHVTAGDDLEQRVRARVTYHPTPPRGTPPLLTPPDHMDLEPLTWFWPRASGPRLGMYFTPQPSGIRRFSAIISSKSHALNLVKPYFLEMWI
ncbi:unnamed protein product [Menidia menidia]|uniref:(Atlantic silverside) hypothetical protein n=1 Tax=Menidia menidia TaxID=238744 RepID=A0A8S4BJ60_9TELE|nr:unnamed protein product [Menidia menidia]